MHFFVAGKDLKNAIQEFDRACIKGAVIRATSSQTIELYGFYKPKESWGTTVRIWATVLLSRDAESAGCEPVMLRLNKFRGIPTGEVEIEADCFGFFVNHAMYAGAIVERPPASAMCMPDLGGDICLAVNVKPEDCRAITWVLRAMDSTEEICKRGFDRLCIREGAAEATDGIRAHRANLSFYSPEMLVPSVMADLMSRQPGELNFREDEEYESAEYRSGSIRMAATRQKCGAWPDFERLMPYGGPSVTILPKRVLETVEYAVYGYAAATVRLSCGKGKRDLIVEGREVKAQEPPYDGPVKAVGRRVETAKLEEPCPFDDFGMGATYNAAYLADALAGFGGYAKMYYADEESPLVLADETGRAAIVMPIV